MMGAQLHNVAIYVGPEDFEEVRSFYAERVGLPIVFEEPRHLCCFGVGPDVAICVHEAEPGHRSTKLPSSRGKKCASPTRWATRFASIVAAEGLDSG